MAIKPPRSLEMTSIPKFCELNARSGYLPLGRPLSNHGRPLRHAEVERTVAAFSRLPAELLGAERERDAHPFRSRRSCSGWLADCAPIRVPGERSRCRSSMPCFTKNAAWVGLCVRPRISSSPMPCSRKRGSAPAPSLRRQSSLGLGFYALGRPYLETTSTAHAVRCVAYRSSHGAGRCSLR